MPADSVEHDSVEQQAIKALAHLEPEEKVKVLEYIESLVNLHEIHNDQGSAV